MSWYVVATDFDGDTVLAKFSDGVVSIEIAADVQELSTDRAVLVRVHVLGPGPNMVGLRIRSLAAYVKELLNVRRLRVEGATRRSGANPGRNPAPLIF